MIEAIEYWRWLAMEWKWLAEEWKLQAKGWILNQKRGMSNELFKICPRCGEWFNLPLIDYVGSCAFCVEEKQPFKTRIVRRLNFVRSAIGAQCTVIPNVTNMKYSSDYTT